MGRRHVLLSFSALNLSRASAGAAMRKHAALLPGGGTGAADDGSIELRARSTVDMK